MGIIINNENSEHYFSDPLREAIFNITTLVKRNNYEEASALMIQNNLTLESLVQRTFKLNDIEIARLGDLLINKRG